MIKQYRIKSNSRISINDVTNSLTRVWLVVRVTNSSYRGKTFFFALVNTIRFKKLEEDLLEAILFLRSEGF